MSLRFNDKNWESFLNNWLSILTHFAKHHINLSASLSLCICDLKCAHFVCWMILFLWLLYFRYLFHAFNVSLDWSRQVEYSTWKVLSRVEIFLKKCWVELRSWIREIELNWKAWFDNLIWKLDSTRQDIR